MLRIKKFIIIISILFSFTASAGTNKDAADFVNDLAQRVISLIKNTNMPESQKERELNNLFLKYVDTKWIARFAMGKYWRTLTPSQQQQYIDLYSIYLTDMYVPNFRKYTGNEVKILGASEIRKGEFLVQTELVDPLNKLNIKINYMLTEKGSDLENFVIFDVIAEGVSLITTQRAEINNIMESKGFNSLIGLLMKKTYATNK